jgi:hypothetical protein
MKAIWYDGSIDVDNVEIAAHLLFSTSLTYLLSHEPADHQGTQPLPTENRD